MALRLIGLNGRYKNEPSPRLQTFGYVRFVRTMKEHGDNDAADRWLQIIVAIETVRQRMERGLSQ
jgi:hypothetical protein